MTKPEKLFHQIATETPGAKEGKMFGAACIKADNGKTAAIFWKDDMIFKLDELGQQEALKLKGARIGSHLYAPERPMKGWILIPSKHAGQWNYFAKKSVEYVNTLKK